MENTEQPVVGHAELHAIIRNAQIAIWDNDGEGATLPYMVADIDTRLIYERFLELLPDSEIANHYRNCETCKRVILQCGNWVVVNYDGTLDPVMFPTIELDAEFHNEWTNVLFELNRFISRLDDGTDVRPVKGLLCRPTDGGQAPTFLRMYPDDQLHFDVFITPVVALTARTLCKLNDRSFALLRKLLSSPGFNNANMIGLMESMKNDFPEYELRNYHAFEAATHVLHVLDEYCSSANGRFNLMITSAQYAEGLKDFPLKALPILDDFERTGDLDALQSEIQDYRL